MTRRTEHFSDARCGVSLCATHWGEENSRTLVLLHGAGANAHWWDHLAPRLAEGFHVVALDFRGHGDSEFPEELIEGAFEDDLDALLRHLGEPQPILVGHSMGAAIALRHAAAHPPIPALVAIDVARGTPAATRKATQRVLAIRRTYQTREQAVARFRFLPGTSSAEESLRKSIGEHSVRAEPDGRFGFKFDPRWFSVPARPLPPLEDLLAPILLIRGSESPLLTPEGAEALTARIPKAELRVIEGSGHHVHLDRPKEVLRAVQDFLGSVL